MRMPGFASEASLSKARTQYRHSGSTIPAAGPMVTQYRHSGSTIPAAGPMVLPQQIVIPPGLQCWLNYQACNSSCANWPIWRRDICYSYCFAIYNRCLRPV
jgi:hypothetical protein